jgi:hypothetical protein
MERDYYIARIIAWARLLSNKPHATAHIIIRSSLSFTIPKRDFQFLRELTPPSPPLILSPTKEKLTLREVTQSKRCLTGFSGYPKPQTANLGLLPTERPDPRIRSKDENENKHIRFFSRRIRTSRVLLARFRLTHQDKK